MQRIFKLKTSKFERIICFGLIVLLAVESLNFKQNYQIVYLQWLVLFISYFAYKKIRSAQPVFLIALTDCWSVIFDNGMNIQFRLNGACQNRKYWIQLCGKINNIIILQEVGAVAKLKVFFWQLISYRITIFIDSVDEQDWHTLKQYVWAL